MTLNQPPTIGEVIQKSRASQQLNMRDFAETLGVSQNMISLWERNINTVEESRLSDWFRDTREWVQDMAIEIFVIKYRNILLASRAPITTA